MVQTQLSVPVRDGYNFGVGADLLSGDPKNKAVDSSHVTSIDGTGGASVNITIQRVQTTSELEQALGIDAEASYGCPSFGAGVSGRFHFAKSASIQTSSLFMTVVATVRLKTLSIDAPTLTPEAAALVDRPDVFSERYGNVFMRSLDRGGIFVGVLRIDTGSSTQSEQVAAELKGSYGLFSADAQMKFGQVEKDFGSSISIQMYHEGGPLDLEIKDVTNPLELLNNVNLFLESFSKRPDDVSVPYVVTLAPISIASGPMPPNIEDLAHAQDVMRFCASRRSALLDQVNQLQFILDNLPRFDFSHGASEKEIAAAAADTQSDIDLVSRCASAAINTPKGAKLPVDFAHDAGTVFPKATMPGVLPTSKSLPADDALAAKGNVLSQQDKLALLIRNNEPEASRRGFDMGMAAADGQTLQGPGKQKFHDLLSPADGVGFQDAVDYTVDRNRNADLAGRGEAVVEGDPSVSAGRTRLPLGLGWLGFDIAAGLFGKPGAGGAGGLGHTQSGPGAQAIRDGLSAGVRSGYDAGKAFFNIK